MPTLTLVVKQLDASASQAEARGHTLIIDRPPEMGGSDKGMMGGEALLSGLGGCFMSNLLAAAKARDVELVNAKAEISGVLNRSPVRFSRIVMRVSAENSSETDFEKLVADAERGCISANTLRGGVDLKIEAV